MEIKEIVAAIPAIDIERAKKFYVDALGLKAETLSNTLNMFWVGKNQNRFLLYQKNEKNKAEHTALSFTVSDIGKTVNKLKSRGVIFYQDNENEVFNLDGSLSAWFTDTEGNNLEISQRPN